MTPAQSVQVTYGNPAVTEVVVGSVGLAGNYRARGWLTTMEQGWVSACLLARVGLSTKSS